MRSWIIGQTSDSVCTGEWNLEDARQKTDGRRRISVGGMRSARCEESLRRTRNRTSAQTRTRTRADLDLDSWTLGLFLDPWTHFDDCDLGSQGDLQSYCDHLRAGFRACSSVFVSCRVAPRPRACRCKRLGSTSVAAALCKLCIWDWDWNWAWAWAHGEFPRIRRAHSVIQTDGATRRMRACCLGNRDRRCVQDPEPGS